MKLWEKKGHSSLDGLVEKFNVGKDYIYDSKLAVYDVKGTIAHVKMLNKIGVLNDEDTIKVLSELEFLEKKFQKEPPTLKIEDEDIHTYIENYLVSRLGELGKKIHTGRSRNDQVLTALRLYEKDKLGKIIESIDNLLKELISLSKKLKESKVPLIGYTHSRQAMPITASFWVESLIEAIEDSRNIIRNSCSVIDKNPLGSAAGYGFPLSLDRDYTRELLGFKGILVNSLYAQNTRGKYESLVVDSLSYLIGDIVRFVNDIIFFSSSEVGFLRLSSSITTGSSIMPHKKNPDVFEIIRAKSKIFFTYSLELKNITFSLTSGYSRDLQETKYLVMDALEEAHEIIDVFRVAIGGIEFDSEKVFKVMDKSIFSVDVAVEVMKKYGISFRDAYRVVGEIIIELTNTSTDELLKKYESMPLEREIVEWFSKDTKELFYYFISKRTQEGYPKL